MSYLKFTYLVSGLNQKLLVYRLQKSKINILDIKFINKKLLKITIDSKDRLKFFAICKNSWYNKLVNIGGLCAPLYKLYKNIALTVGLIAFFSICYFSNNLYFKTDYLADSHLYKTQIQSAMQSAGIKKFKPFTQEQLDKASELVREINQISFITITKKGGSAVVYLKQSVAMPLPLKTYASDFVAPEDLVILKITVYSGTQLKNQGDYVKKGEVIAKAGYIIQEKEYPCLLSLALTAECTFEYIYNYSGRLTSEIKTNALALAKIYLGDYPVRSYSLKEINNNKLKVIIKYEKTLCGG